MKKTLLIFFILTAGNVYAQSAVILPGSRPGTDSGIVNFVSGNSFYTRVLPDESVYCRYRGGIGNDIVFSTTLGCLTGVCPTGRLVGDSNGGIDTAVGVDDALAFIADNNDDGGGVASNNRYQITLTTVSGGGSIIVECFNTTLFGNFNTVTAANPYNFLEISNDCAIDANTRIVVTKNDGTELARVNVNVPAKQQRDIAVHDIAGAANTFGRITVAHNSAQSCIRAKITKYTSTFAITASDKFETKENEQ